MKIEKTVGVVTLIAILLLSVATTLGNFLPISHAQVDGETDLGNIQDGTDYGSSTNKQTDLGRQ